MPVSHHDKIYQMVDAMANKEDIDPIKFTRLFMMRLNGMFCRLKILFGLPIGGDPSMLN